MVFYAMSDLNLGEQPKDGRQTMALAQVGDIVDRVRGFMTRDVMGRDDVIELILVALFGGGHVLLEDYPGSGKTTLAKALGSALEPDQLDTELAAFRRIQFTPDLLPSDVTGVMVFDPQTNDFHFRRGPIFAQIVLVDEINRTSPKVQSALLESMGEGQVTIDNVSYKLDDLFFVIATQNPLDSVGTYPLPVAQLDRFLFKISMKHVSRDAELDVLNTWGTPTQRAPLNPVSKHAILSARQAIHNSVHVAKEIKECLVDLARTIREDTRTAQGVSTRSLVQAIPALQTLAVIRGRDYIAPSDIERLSPHLFHHRISVVPGAGQVDDILADAIKSPIDALNRSTI
ncbi:MAG: AAA family ATPase [Myxococcota bacterium]|nr:AAA family ATPase [Myxococcota bacterium]